MTSYQLLFLCCLVTLCAVYSTSAGSAVCSNGHTRCNGCQCCPDGYLCPNAPQSSSCPARTCRKGYSGSRPTPTTAKPNPQPGNEKHQIEIINRCSQTVWIGLLGNPGHGEPLEGGFELKSDSSKKVLFEKKWVGRMWGRTGCKWSGDRLWCETGDCGGSFKCNGKGGKPPATLAEINFEAWAGLDYYDVSLVDGYNLPVKFDPVKKYQQGRCLSSGCVSDLLLSCPEELKERNKSGKVVGCLSSCSKYKTDEYCCHGAYDTPDKCTSPKHLCKPSWDACPDAYCYAYDDHRGTFSCKDDNETTHYTVTFC